MDENRRKVKAMKACLVLAEKHLAAAVEQEAAQGAASAQKNA
jgi:hypothetical protein